jgi:hypothetical protein
MRSYARAHMRGRSAGSLPAAASGVDVRQKAAKYDNHLQDWRAKETHSILIRQA